MRVEVGGQVPNGSYIVSYAKNGITADAVVTPDQVKSLGLEKAVLNAVARVRQDWNALSDLGSREKGLVRRGRHAQYPQPGWDPT